MTLDHRLIQWDFPKKNHHCWGYWWKIPEGGKTKSCCPGCYAKIWGRIRWFQGEINKKMENFRGSLQQTSQEIQFIFWKSPIYKQKWKQNLTSVLLWSLQKPHSLRIIHLFLRLYLHWWVERSVHTGIQMLACCTGFVEWMYTNQLCWSDLWNEKNSIYYSLWVFLSYKISLEN